MSTFKFSLIGKIWDGFQTRKSLLFLDFLKYIKAIVIKQLHLSILHTVPVLFLCLLAISQ